MYPCPGCNQQIAPNAKFCPHCGFRMQSPAAGGKLLTGLPWVDGLIGFILFYSVPMLGFALSSLDSALGSIAGLGLWFGVPLVLGLGLRYRAMALGYIIGLGVSVSLILGALMICVAIAASGGFGH